MTTMLLLVSCSSGMQPLASASAQSVVPKGAQSYSVVIRELKFHPAVLTVAVGDTVEWKNEDIVPHTAISTESKEFDSGSLAVGSSWKYVATKSGTYFYNCTLHPNMRGKLVVQ